MPLKRRRLPQTLPLALQWLLCPRLASAVGFSSAAGLGFLCIGDIGKGERHSLSVPLDASGVQQCQALRQKAMRGTL